MWRAPAVSLGLLLVAYLEFKFFPGHTYLAGRSQLYLPILEHLATPGYLSRDLVATHPNVAYTVYDEVTLFLRAGGRLDFHKALVLQQEACRLAGLVGVFLLARAAGLKRLPAFATASVINLGTFLPGPNVLLIDGEPVPRAFSFNLVFLAMGLLAREKPLLAGLAGGFALLYDPVAGAPFWVALSIAFVLDRKLRRLLRPIAPFFVVFILLLANLAQLQPGTPDSQGLFDRFTGSVAAIQKFRNPELWISLWPAQFVYLYFALFVISIWASTRIRPALNKQTKWLVTILPLLGILTMPLSGVLVEHYRSSAILRFEPMQMLTYTVELAWFVCLIAAFRAIKIRARAEALAWFAISLLLLVVPSTRRLPLQKPASTTADLAAWAETSTWGSSMFLFPDAGAGLYPGAFRAQSRRALWVDWQGGGQISSNVALAPEWSRRWHSTMEGPLSGDHLQNMLPLPVDYFVFGSNYVVEVVSAAGISSALAPAFSKGPFRVYDAETLRIVPGRLALKRVAPNT